MEYHGNVDGPPRLYRALGGALVHASIRSSRNGTNAVIPRVATRVTTKTVITRAHAAVQYAFRRHRALWRGVGGLGGVDRGSGVLIG